MVGVVVVALHNVAEGRYKSVISSCFVLCGIAFQCHFMLPFIAYFIAAY